MQNQTKKGIITTSCRAVIGPGYPVRILIVENDALFAKELAETLHRHGHEIRLSGELRCLENIRRMADVDAVFTGIFLENISGLQIVLDIKKFDPSIKVVAISSKGAGGQFDYLDYAVEFGADAVLRKPLDQKRLAEVLLLVAGEGQPPAEPARPALEP